MEVFAPLRVVRLGSQGVGPAWPQGLVSPMKFEQEEAEAAEKDGAERLPSGPHTPVCGQVSARAASK